MNDATTPAGLGRRTLATFIDLIVVPIISVVVMLVSGAMEVAAAYAGNQPYLRAFALALADLPTPDHGPATAVRVQVWHTEFDPIDLVPVGRIHRSLEVSLQP